MNSKTVSKAQLRALARAANRPRGNICPTVGVGAAASDSLVAALDRRGFVEWNAAPWKSTPYISDAGRAVIES